MNKLKNRIIVLLIFVMCLVIINVNIKANALDFEHIKKLSSVASNGTVITEYGISDDVVIDIDSISLESAVDSTCDETCVQDNPSDVNNNQVTGSITCVEDQEESSDNSNIYYIGETSTEGTISEVGVISDNGSEVLSSSEGCYYVENWQELEGDLSIKVNKQASCVTVYKGETPIKAMVCSAGESTPEGTFYMDLQWEWLMLIKGQYGRYCSQISGDYLFHSVPYNSMDIYDLDTEMYNQLGTLCSHGCIRLTVEDAKWIYDNCSAGTEVTIYNDSNPGPMGKPGFTQIPEGQTWDPTDIDVE